MMALRDACRRYDVRVHGFVLMTTHFHLLATPATPQSLPRTMQQVGRRYVPYFNKRRDRTGCLWEGRYRSHLVRNNSGPVPRWSAFCTCTFCSDFIRSG